MEVKAILNHILFQFIDEVTTAGMFVEQKTAGGIILPTSGDSSAKGARWGKIVSVGPDCCTEIKQATEVLIEPLKWTAGVTFEAQMYWRTDEKWVLGYR